MSLEKRVPLSASLIRLFIISFSAESLYANSINLKKS